MKIALVILHADPNRGGAERYTVDLAAGLRQRGHAVSLIASTFPAALGPGDVLLSCPAATRVGRYSRFLNSLDRHLDGNPYDIVHAMLPVRRCDVYHPHAGIAADAAAGAKHAAARGLQKIVAQAGTRLNLRRQRFAAVERSLLTSSNPPVVLCLSDYVKQFVRQYYDLPAEKLATLFNAVDTARFDPASRPDAHQLVRDRFGFAATQPLALFIAQDFVRKGLSEAIAGLAEAQHKNLSLLVVGKQDVGPYRRMAEQAGVAHRVVFAGPTDDPVSCYLAADFFVLPTRHDPCSLVVLEALAMGLPVISTVFNGACEIMTDGKHGFVLPDPTDIRSIASAMDRLSNPEARRELSRQCLSLRPALAYDHHLDELIRIYDGLISQRKKRVS